VLRSDLSETMSEFGLLQVDDLAAVALRSAASLLVV
jgi:hypothetical protein